MLSIQDIPDEILIEMGTFLDHYDLKEFLAVSSRFHRKGWSFWKEKARCNLSLKNSEMYDFDPPEDVSISPFDRYIEYATSYGRKFRIKNQLALHLRHQEMGRTETETFIMRTVLRCPYLKTDFLDEAASKERYSLIEKLVTRPRDIIEVIYQAGYRDNANVLDFILNLSVKNRNAHEKIIQARKRDLEDKREGDFEDEGEYSEEEKEEEKENGFLEDLEIKKHLAGVVTQSLHYGHLSILDYAITKGFIPTVTNLVSAVNHVDVLIKVIDRFHFMNLQPFIEKAIAVGMLPALRFLGETKFGMSVKKIPLKIIKAAVNRNVHVNIFDYLFKEMKIVFGHKAYRKVLQYAIKIERRSHITYFLNMRNGDHVLAAKLSANHHETLEHLLEHHFYSQKQLDKIMHCAVSTGNIRSIEVMIQKGVKLPPNAISIAYNKVTYLVGRIKRLIELGAKDAQEVFPELFYCEFVAEEDLEELAKNVPQSLVRAFHSIFEDYVWSDNRNEILRKYAYPS